MIPTDEAGGRAEHQSRQSLLQAASGVGRRSCTDAAHGRVASGVPFRRRAHAAGAAGCRGEQGGPASCENADAADGDGNGLSQAEYLQARARPRDLSVSAAWPCQITDEAHFTNDLGADWLDRLELMMVVEDQ